MLRKSTRTAITATPSLPLPPHTDPSSIALAKYHNAHVLSSLPATPLTLSASTHTAHTNLAAHNIIILVLASSAYASRIELKVGDARIALSTFSKSGL